MTIRTTGLDDYLDGGSGRIKVLIMGSPGSGKTRSSSYWPKPLLADCEDGRMSVADRAIPYAAIKTTADMKALLDLAESEGRRPKDQRRFETLVIDTLDSYQRIVIQEHLTSTKKAQMSGWQDWGHLDAEMSELVARLSGIPMNVIVNLHVKDTKVGGSDDGDGGYLVKSPKLKGDLKDQIAAEFDLVGFMETDWVAVDGKRTLTRYVQWESSPDKPILKDRSGQLPKRTPVDFTAEDYDGLLRPLAAAQEKLTAGSVVVEVEMPAPAEHVPVAKGGPVVTSVPVSGTTKKAAPPVPAVTTPVAAAPVPLPETNVTEAEAVATVEQVLGGEVVEEETSPPEPPPEPATPVATPVHDEPVAEIPGDGTITVNCGQPRYAGGTVSPSIEACGQELVLDMQEDRVTGCSSPAGQVPDLIQIGGLKTRAFLCNGCFAAHRHAASKATSGKVKV